MNPDKQGLRTITKGIYNAYNNMCIFAKLILLIVVVFDVLMVM